MKQKALFIKQGWVDVGMLALEREAQQSEAGARGVQRQLTDMASI